MPAALREAHVGTRIHHGRPGLSGRAAGRAERDAARSAAASSTTRSSASPVSTTPSSRASRSTPTATSRATAPGSSSTSGRTRGSRWPATTCRSARTAAGGPGPATGWRSAPTPSSSSARTAGGWRSGTSLLALDAWLTGRPCPPRRRGQVSSAPAPLLSPAPHRLPIASAFVAGFIDSIAGGGGLITLPALLAAGLPPQIAIGTNKGQAVFGAFASVASFWRERSLDRDRAVLGFAAGFVRRAGRRPLHAGHPGRPAARDRDGAAAGVGGRRARAPERRPAPADPLTGHRARRAARDRPGAGVLRRVLRAGHRLDAGGGVHDGVW